MYSALQTRESYSARHMSLNGYADLPTRNDQGMRGLGDVPPISFAIGPGGQFQVSAQSVPNATSMWDQVKVWMGESTVIAGVPNSLILIGGGVFGLAFLFRGHR